MEALDTRLGVSELDRLLQAADPCALLVPPRLLRRVIKRDRRVIGPALLVPHRKGYAIGREVLLKLAGRDELGIPPNCELPEEFLLIAKPEPKALAAVSRDAALVKYWRLSFHAAVHRAVGSLRLSAADAR